MPHRNQEDEYTEKVAAADKVAENILSVIANAPANVPAGLAVKAYLLLHQHDEGWRDDWAALSAHDQTDLGKALLTDAVRFVPELAPLAADALENAARSDTEDAAAYSSQPRCASIK